MVGRSSETDLHPTAARADGSLEPRRRELFFTTPVFGTVITTRREHIHMKDLEKHANLLVAGEGLGSPSESAVRYS